MDAVFALFGNSTAAACAVQCYTNIFFANSSRQLCESEARAKRILQSIGDAAIITDAQARILRKNRVAEGLSGPKSMRKGLERIAVVESCSYLPAKCGHEIIGALARRRTVYFLLRRLHSVLPPME